MERGPTWRSSREAGRGNYPIGQQGEIPTATPRPLDAFLTPPTCRPAEQIRRLFGARAGRGSRPQETFLVGNGHVEALPGQLDRRPVVLRVHHRTSPEASARPVRPATRAKAIRDRTIFGVLRISRLDRDHAVVTSGTTLANRDRSSVDRAARPAASSRSASAGPGGPNNRSSSARCPPRRQQRHALLVLETDLARPLQRQRARRPFAVSVCLAKPAVIVVTARRCCGPNRYRGCAETPLAASATARRPAPQGASDETSGSPEIFRRDGRAALNPDWNSLVPLRSCLAQRIRRRPSADLPQHLAAADVVGAADEAVLLHPLDPLGGGVVADAHLALEPAVDAFWFSNTIWHACRYLRSSGLSLAVSSSSSAKPPSSGSSVTASTYSGVPCARQCSATARPPRR